MDFEIRKPEDFDIPQILRIFAENDPDRALLFNGRYYDWQFKSFPYEVKSLVAAINDRVIAFGALLPFKASVKGETCIVFEGVEFIVLPEFRWKGVFKTLASALYEQINNQSHTFAFASPNSFRAYRRKLGHRFIGHFPYWIGIPDIQAIIQKKFRILSILQKPLYQWTELKLLRVSNDAVTNNINYFDERWDVTETWEYKSDFYLRKNSTYLNWRYVSHPYHKYDIYGVYRDGQPLGYVVLRGQNLIDIAYADIEILKILLNKAISYFKEKRVLMANTYLKLDMEGTKIMREMRFWPCNILQGKFSGNMLYPIQRIMVKSKNKDIVFPELIRWFFTMGDIDCKL